MRSDVSVMALAAMAASASAQAATPGFNSIHTPAENAVLDAGTTQSIKWTVGDVGKNDPVCIQLICGDTPQTLEPEKTNGTITCGISNSAANFSWSIPKDFPEYKMCGIKMYLEETPTTMQYSGHFTVKTKAGPPSEGEQGGAASGVQPPVPGASDSQAAPLASDSSAVTSLAPAVTSAPALLNSTAPIATAIRNCAAACGADGGSGGDEVTLSTETSTTLSAGGPATLASQTRSGVVANPSGGPSGAGPSTASRSSTPFTGGAPAVGAGILGVLGGLAVAVLAL